MVLYDTLGNPGPNLCNVNLASRRDQAARLAELKARLEQLRRDLGDVDPPGPTPMSQPCRDAL